MSSTCERALLAALLVAACGGDDRVPSADGAPPSDAAAGTPDAGAAAGACDQPGTAPPGQRIALEVLRPAAGVWELYLVGLSGPFPVCPVPTTLTSREGAGNAVWSPDGQMLAISVDDALYLIDARQATPSAPVQVSPPDTTAAAWVEWSPDSRWLGFGLVHADGAYDGYLVEVIGGVPGDRIDLMPGVPNTGPFWSPGGQGFLTFSSSELYWVPMEPDGPGTPHLVAPEVMETQWSPDGDRLLFSVRGETRSDVFLTDPGPGGAGVARQVTNHLGAGHVYDFGWSPDSRRLLYLVSGSPRRLFVADMNEATPAARRVDDPDLGPIFQFGWMDAQQIRFEAASRLYLVDLVGGVPQPPSDPAGGREVVAMAPDHSAIVTQDYDGERLLHDWVPLGGAGDAVRMATLTAGGSFHFTASSSWFLQDAHIFIPAGQQDRYQLMAFDARSPGAPPVLLRDSEVDSRLLRGPGDHLLVIEDEPNRPPVLLHGDLAEARALEPVLADPPFDWTLGVIWAPSFQ